MGGNALKNAKTRRYSADEYHKLAEYVLNSLRRIFPTCRSDVIPAYSFKESFGDMDVVVESDNLPADYVDKLINTFKPDESVKNGNVISLNVEEIQLDFIAAPASVYETSLSYFAYNDLGNLLGRVAHSIGLKLGHDGLSYNWRVGTYQFRNIILLTDWKDILPVLGYSYERYVEGFDTLEDIFKFVVSSPFFNRNIYLLNNRNHTSRVRDSKRKTYMGFLKWIEDYEETEEQKLNSLIPVNSPTKARWLPYLFAEIPDFKETYDEVQAEWAAEVEFRSRFNGDLVKEWTGLSGKELGEFMKWLRENTNAIEFKKHILTVNKGIVRRYVEYYYDKYTGNLSKMEVNELNKIAFSDWLVGKGDK